MKYRSISSVPRGMTMSPRADSTPVQLLAEINTAVNDFRSRYDGRIDAVENSVSAVETALDKILAASGANRLGGNSGVAFDPSYTETFATFVRKGEGENDLRRINGEGLRGQINAAMSVGTASEGGYLAPTEWDREVRKALVAVSPLRRLATVMSTGVGAFSTVWNTGAWGTGWVGEKALRPETSSPGLSSLEFASGEIYSNVAVTQRLLDDAEFNVEQWLSAENAVEFARQESIAFLSGDGVNKPFGFLTYVDGGAADDRHPGGNLTTVETVASVAIGADELVDFAYSLPAPYRSGAAWLMNSSTAARIAKLKDGEGNYLWREAFAVGQPATLLGYPVEIDEGMPNVAAGALSVAFGNFQRGYLINDRWGTRLLRDPYTNKPFVMFYTTKRVGGGVLDPNAIRLLKIKP